MAVKSVRIACVVLMFCVLTPLIAGYIMPGERSTEEGWETTDSHDITDTVRTTEIPTYAMDPTQLSGLWNPAGTTPSGTASGVITPPSSTSTLEYYDFLEEYSNLPIASYRLMTDDEVGTASRVTLEIIPVYPAAPAAPVGPHAMIPASLVTGGESTGHVDVGVFSGGSMVLEGGDVVFWSANGYDVTPSTPVWDVRYIELENVENPNTTYRINAVIEYPQTTVPTLNITLGAESIRGSFRLTMINATDSTTSINLVYPNLTYSLETIVSDGAISGRVVMTEGLDTSTVATIDNIGTIAASPYVRWTWDAVQDVVTMSTMISQTEAFYSESVSVSLSPVRVITANFDGSGSWRPVIISYDNWIAGGVQLGIQNATIIGSNFYPDRNWAIQIKQPSTIGSSLSIGGVSFQIIGGNISINGENAPVRNLIILSLSNGDGTADLYANGSLITTTSDQRIYLGGTWNTSVVLWDVDTFTYDKYTHTWGDFGLTQQGYLSVGLMASALIFVGGFALSHHNLTMFLAIGGTSAICAIVYLVLLMETIVV